MSDVALAEGQYEIGDFLFGESNTVEPTIRVEEVQFSSAEIEHSDSSNPREDNITMGIDYKRGRLISFIINITTSGSALDTLDAFEGVWDAERFRKVPGSYTTLRMCRGGRTRRVYGRPRRFTPTSKYSASGGWVPVTCDFLAVHHKYYSDTLESSSVSIIPPSSGGLVGPLEGPLVGAGTTEIQGDIQVGGTADTWLVSRINGPILNPQIEVVGKWSAKTLLDLDSDQYLDIDPQTWSRKVRRSTGASEGGKFTHASQPITEMLVSPGPAEVVLRGTDPTGTASAMFSWRPAYNSF